MNWLEGQLEEALEFFTKLVRIIEMPLEILDNAAKAIDQIQFNEMILYDYLGYMHYAMGTPLYVLFSTIALVTIAIAIYNVITKAISRLVEMIPGA